MAWERRRLRNCSAKAHSRRLGAASDDLEKSHPRAADPSRKGRSEEEGQSLVELALVLPIFLLLLFVIVDFGMGFQAWIAVTSSAREGARLGINGADASAIVARVRATADTLDQSKLGVTVTNAQGLPGESVVVGVNYSYDLITPLAGILGLLSAPPLGPTLNFLSTAEMRLE